MWFGPFDDAFPNVDVEKDLPPAFRLPALRDTLKT
jgi:hypothetical protein